MPVVNIADLSPGMALAKQVLDPEGNLLARAGTVLDQNTIDWLGRKGIAAVTVQGESPSPFEAATDYASRFFLFVDLDHEFMRVLYMESLKRTAAAMAQGFSPPTRPEDWDARVTHLRDVFFKDEGSPEDLVRQEVELSSFPKVYFRIREALDKPATTAETLAGLVEMDPGLAVRLLKLVNSPLYGFASQIDSISRAVAMVGVQELSTLALGVSAISVFQDVPPELIDMRTYWTHCVGCGVLARILGQQAGLPGESLFVAGLLHDIGRLLILKRLPLASAQALIYARENYLPHVEAEKDVLGFDHALVGGLLAEEWSLPEHLANAIRLHHEPMAGNDPGPPAVVQAADTIFTALEVARGGRFMVPGVNAQAWDMLGIDSEFLKPAIQRFDLEFEAATSIFLNDEGPGK
ncbi:MAG: HDOD domain-containing protein [Desulfovibrio sp.]|mgnify:CR=1 FL=1|nr:MAG: HDOD domain-containing protein [Desulfovibrio sp.]